MGLFEKKKCWQFSLMLPMLPLSLETGSTELAHMGPHQNLFHLSSQIKWYKFWQSTLTHRTTLTQISNNDSPFNRKKIQAGTKSRDISLQTIRPHHPFSDPVKNLIRPKQRYENENNEQELWTWMAFLDS